MISFRCKVVDGKLKIKNLKYYNDMLNMYEGKEVRVSIDQYHPDKTINMLRYYWGIVIATLCREINGDAKVGKYQMHREVKRVLVDKGFLDPKQTSISEMDTKQFAEYIQLAREWMLREHNINTPDPDGYYLIDDYDE